MSDHTGLSLPEVDLSGPVLSDKDLADPHFALELGVDFVALSFVRHPDDAKAVRKVLDEAGSLAQVVAKIEKPRMVAHLPEVVAAFDTVMLARGDLGVETALEQVPLVQKQVVHLVREAGRPVIIATQMPESMITHPRPT